MGVSAVPECSEVTLSKEDRMVVLASDGVWEFMSNEEVASIVYPYYHKGNAEKASEILVQSACSKWKAREAQTIDDITCVIIFIQMQE